MRFAHLAQRVYNVPLAIHPDKAEIITAALAERLGLTSIDRDGVVSALQPMAFDDDGVAEDRSAAWRRGYEIVGGVAIVPIQGTLVQKLGTLRPYSGMTGYDGIRQVFFTALTDPKVRAIMLDVDSPGGEVAGCFDLVDDIYTARGDKPIWAILNENAFSAAYALASAADWITVPRTGGTGSIGVIAMHVDWSKALSEAGLKVTLVTYGDRKADGHKEFPLSDEARARWQAEVDKTGRLFVDTVARNRRLAAKVVRDTQAATYFGADGVKLGLADAVQSPAAAFRALQRKLART